MSISSLEKEDGPLCKYLISYPINPEDPGRDSGSPDHSLWMVSEQPQWCGQMNIAIRLTKVQHEMLKELLQREDKRYKKGLENKDKSDIKANYREQ